MLSAHKNDYIFFRYTKKETVAYTIKNCKIFRSYLFKKKLNYIAESNDVWNIDTKTMLILTGQHAWIWICWWKQQIGQHLFNVLPKRERGNNVVGFVLLLESTFIVRWQKWFAVYYLCIQNLLFQFFSFIQNKYAINKNEIKKNNNSSLWKYNSNIIWSFLSRKWSFSSFSTTICFNFFYNVCYLFPESGVYVYESE